MKKAVFFVLVFTFSPSLFSQMLDPSIDRPDEPFCYFSKPTDVIGVMDGRQGTLVSPEGYFYTGWGELVFFTGNPPVLVNQRVKTLLDGYIPVNQYTIVENNIRYRFSAFAATLDGNPESPLINFIRVELRNLSSGPRTAYLGVGLRYQGETNTLGGVADNRFRRPLKSKTVGPYEQAGVEFSPNWVYQYEQDAVARDSAVMYLFPTNPEPVRLMTLKSGYNGHQAIKSAKATVAPSTPVGIVNYPLSLQPGESRTLDFKMPYAPVPLADPGLDALRAASYDNYLAKTVAFWRDMVGKGMSISVPEEKVANTFRANLVYDLIARNKIDSFYVQKVNDFHYHAFWLRDASYIVRMYDLTGYHDVARQCLDFFQRWQQPDGNFVSQGGQYDGWGQTLWAFGQHFRLTQDKEFARKVFPSILKAVEWLKQARMSDSLHLVPITSPGDNEDITGHVTGHNVWALVGLRNAEALAEGIGRTGDARSFRKEYDDLHDALVKQLRKIAKVSKGYIPPGIENTGGQDWDNMAFLYPEILLDPHDPLVTATLDSTRKKYQEGLMTYGDGRFLHHYLTMTNTEAEVVRGDQEMAIRELYALLVHTSATNAGFEYAVLPWSTRDFGMNLSPHGWFAAQYRALVRNMLVREEGNDLHLLSCVSPEWMKDGDTISVHNAPTNFGSVNYDLVAGPGKASLTVSSKYFKSPENIVVHIPWFMHLQSAKGDGKELRVKNGQILLPPDARSVELRWTRKAGSLELSYGKAVEEYKKEYKQRYEDFLVHGQQVY